MAVELADGGPTEELEELVWLTIDQAGEADTPMITRTILGDLRQRLESDPDLSPETPVPFYYMRHRRFVRDIL